MNWFGCFSYLLIVFGAPLAYGIVVAVIRQVWPRNPEVGRFLREPGLCANCGYDLTGNVSGVCPECGRPVR